MKSKYKQKAENVREQAVVKDATGEQKPIEKVVADAADNRNLHYNKPVEETLKNNLNPEQLNVVKNLENERGKGDDSEAKKTHVIVNEAIENTKSLVGKSTVLRVFDKIGNDTSDILGIPKVNDKGGKKND